MNHQSTLNSPLHGQQMFGDSMFAIVPSVSDPPEPDMVTSPHIVLYQAHYGHCAHQGFLLSYLIIARLQQW